MPLNSFLLKVFPHLQLTIEAISTAICVRTSEREQHQRQGKSAMKRDGAVQQLLSSFMLPVLTRYLYQVATVAQSDNIPVAVRHDKPAAAAVAAAAE